MKKILLCFILFIGFAQLGFAQPYANFYNPNTRENQIINENIKKNEEIKKAKEEAKARALERERKLKKQSEINRLNKARDDELVVIDCRSKTAKVLSEHLSIDTQLENERPFKIATAKNDQDLMNKWNEIERKKNENMRELNNKLSAIEIECKSRLNANQIKYDTKEQKNYIDY